VATLKSRVERLEKEQQFRTWIAFERFLESLTDEQLKELSLHWRFPEVLPEPFPKGASRLDGLDRKTLLKLWEEKERETARIMDEMKGRSARRAQVPLGSPALAGTIMRRKKLSQTSITSKYCSVVAAHLSWFSPF